MHIFILRIAGNFNQPTLAMPAQESDHTMRKFRYLLLMVAVICVAIHSCNDHKTDIIAETTSPVKLKEDLALLKQLLEDAHAGTFSFTNKKYLNRLFDSISTSITEPITKREFLNKVDYIIEQLHCAHTNCFFDQAYLDTLVQRKYFFPIPLMRIGDQIFINTDTYNIPFGSEVFLINNHTTKEIFNKLSFHEHTDGLSTGNKASAINDDFPYDFFLAFGPQKEFVIRYRDAETKVVEIKTADAESLNFIDQSSGDINYNFPTSAPYDFTIDDEKCTGILTVRTFDQPTYQQQSAFKNFLQNSFSLMKYKVIKNLVIDYRNNTGGHFACSYTLLSHFITSPLIEFDSVIRRFNQLPFKNYVSVNDSSTRMLIDSSYEGYQPTANRNYAMKAQQIDTCFPAEEIFKGKIFVITNSNVISAAASSTSLLKELAGATVIGEETGGGYAEFNSEILSYTLPNSGIKVDIPTLRYYTPVRKKESTVQPDHYIPINKTDFLNMDDGPMKFVMDSLIR